MSPSPSQAIAAHVGTIPALLQAALTGVKVGVATLLVGVVTWVFQRLWRHHQRRRAEVQARRDGAATSRLAAQACQEFDRAYGHVRRAATQEPNALSTLAREIETRFLDRDPRLSRLTSLIDQCQDTSRRQALFEKVEAVRSSSVKCASFSPPSGLEPTEAIRVVQEPCDAVRSAIQELRRHLYEHAEWLEPPAPAKPRGPTRWQRLRRFRRYLGRWYIYVTDSENVSPGPPPSDDWPSSGF